MNASLATGYRCRDCDRRLSDPSDCPDCGGLARVDIEAAGGANALDSPWTDWLVESGPPTEAGIGGTPLVSAPATAAAFDVAGLAIKREGANPTGSITDRGLAPAIAAVTSEAVHLASPGPGARSAAALAARAGLDATLVVPSRSRFDAKAMVNVYGGEMRVVEGRYDDARAATADLPGASLAPFATGRRIAGLRTIAVELAGADLDAIVVPIGHGHLPIALDDGFVDCLACGAIETVPDLYAAQPAGCAPIVDGEPVDRPDTVCGALEIPDPVAPERTRAAVVDGVAVTDDDLLATAVDTARRDGVATSTAGGVGLAAVRRLRADGALDATDRVAVIDPLTARSDADILRSHLMRTGE
ncbi:pyridoxal-phosphate dependent enzyme [Halococcoides cellulosivorans]|uniref:Tryptophan synthase beta chain-like PALP domain-containing protein n=1 Tax=Halococcoides cellulosivorans TaxID=1679096 RepID=A0A2R4X1T7_9EURY|nr:pyridoxal-phosphate dependent enzyme [Halococcoides cellulosivorans]AWB27770.1 hypothetical protein HARCEL1_08625 [Halococcoides cellulosivorans]